VLQVTVPWHLLVAIKFLAVSQVDRINSCAAIAAAQFTCAACTHNLAWQLLPHTS
jgi:hypothetical protein